MSQGVEADTLHTGRSRTWCFTINNWTEPMWDKLVDWPNKGCGIKYLVVGRERGEQGTPHLQGFVRFKHQKIFSVVKQLFQRFIGVAPHLEIAMGNDFENQAYCKKEDNEAFEWGEPAVQGKRTDIDAAAALVQAKGAQAVAEEMPSLYVKFHKGLEALENKTKFKGRDPDDPPMVIYVSGPSGAGKTRGAFELAKRMYPNEEPYMGAITSSGKVWWDGYKQQSCVILDEFRYTDVPAAYMLRLLDRYPFRVEYKGGSIPFNSPLIIVTSIQRYTEWYNGEDNVQFERRAKIKMDITVPEDGSVNTWWEEILENESSMEDQETSSDDDIDREPMSKRVCMRAPAGTQEDPIVL